MNQLFIFDSHIFTFLVVLFRIGGFFLTAPFFSLMSIPPQIKILLTLMISFIVTLQVGVYPFSNDISIIIVGLKELLFGLMLGWGIKIVFELIQGAGQIIGQQGGFALANLYDPVMQSQSNVMAKFLNILIFLIFLSINGHIIVLQTFFESYNIISINFSIKYILNFNFGIKTFISVFALSIRIAAPIMIATLTVYSALGIMAKVAPQMNLFIMSFPIIILATTAIFSFIIDGIAMIVLENFDLYLKEMLISLQFKV